MRLYENEPDGSDLKEKIQNYLQNLKYILNDNNNFQEWNISKWKAKELLKDIEGRPTKLNLVL